VSEQKDASTLLKESIKAFLESETSNPESDIDCEVKLSGQFSPLKEEDKDRVYVEVTVFPDLGTAGTAEVLITFSSLSSSGIDKKLGNIAGALQNKEFSMAEYPIFATKFKLEEAGDVGLMMSTKGNEEFYSKAAKMNTKYIERGDF